MIFSFLIQLLNYLNELFIELFEFSSFIIEKGTNSFDMIIADRSCPQEIVEKAKQFKIPIVSGEYILQCLINGRKLSVDAHPKFCFDSE